MTDEDHSKLGESKKMKQSCLQWLVLKLKLTEEGATPPNWKYIFLVFAALTFGYSENEKGTYAGLVASSVFAGRIVGSVFWGWLADRSGRKIVFLITIALNGVCAGLFGFSSNLIMAMVFRFLCGAVNGTVGTAKAVLYDISDNSNQALSMSMLSISWGMGMIVGPAVGERSHSPAPSPQGAAETEVPAKRRAEKSKRQEATRDTVNRFAPLAMDAEDTISSIWGDSSTPSSPRASASPMECPPSPSKPQSPSKSHPLSPAEKPQGPPPSPSPPYPFTPEVHGHWWHSGQLSQDITVSDSAEGKEKPSPQETTGDSYTPLLTNKPGYLSSHIYLGQSVNSLHVEAECTAFFAQEMLSKRHKAAAAAASSLRKDTNSQVMFVSVPDLTQPGTGNSAQAMFLSTPDIMALNSPTKPKPVSLQRKDKNPKSRSSFAPPSSDYIMNGKGTVINDIDGPVEIIVCPIDKAPTKSDPMLGDNGDVITAPSNGFGDHKGVDRLYTGDASAEKGDVEEEDQEEENICTCVEMCCSSPCCFSCRKTSFFKLLRLENVWASIMLYVVFSFICIGVDDIFPVFASTREDYGGLGFSTDEIGLAIGTTFLPLLFLQIKLYPFLVSRMGVRKVFLICAIICMVSSQLIPVVRLLKNNTAMLWTCLMLVQIPFKITTMCCFAGTSLMINNSVTPDLAGQANGLGMMATAIARTIAPALAGSLFSWSVTYGPQIGPPFDTSFPFFVMGSLFLITVVECLQLDPRLDRQRK
ncbi:protein Zinc induced facilitator 1 [Plakobranchus ocellatus]|uniref:Protein Zinc induced facilitator 1 n=1 Tax=Plakobranchus ocellatus TaxID=259542 RepID=A0AAV4BM47_9GAST|nr:protein Zinc induced facilitator 1 [Plakobranchus ocellatus]